MAGDDSNTAESCKRAAENAAKVVLAKHTYVVPGGIVPIRRTGEPSRHGTVDIGVRNISRGLKR